MATQCPQWLRMALSCMYHYSGLQWPRCHVASCYGISTASSLAVYKVRKPNSSATVTQQLTTCTNQEQSALVVIDNISTDFVVTGVRLPPVNGTGAA